MPHIRSPEVAAVRRDRALARGFLVQVEKNKKHALVAVEVAERKRAIAASLLAHPGHKQLTGIHCHNASRAAAVARPWLPSPLATC